MPRRQEERKTSRPAFTGFEPPSSNYFRMPTSWTDITAEIDNLAELKVVEYVLRHTWGYQEYGIKKHITMDEFVQGRRRRDGSRMDHGTGLSERAVRYGLAKAVEHGLIDEEVDDTDRGRVKKWYGLRMKQHAVSPETADHHGQGLQAGVQTLHPSLQDVLPKGARSTPRSEIDTLERKPQQHVVVVDALRNFGISKPTANQLARTYPEQYILEKLDFVQWLKETRSSLVAKNPAGYLRRALEEDYQPPPIYKPPAQRQAEQERKVKQLELEQQERQDAEEQFLKTKQQTRKALAKECPPQQIPGTDLTTETAWHQVLAHLKEQMTDANYQTWLRDTRLVSWSPDTALIVTPNSYQRDWLGQRFAPLIEKELQQVLGLRVSTKYLALSELASQQGPIDQAIANLSP
jgi:hypothetical protein